MTQQTKGKAMLAISVQGLTKTYAGAGRPALNDLNLVVTSGLCTGILGPNGSGKTTLLEILQGVRKPDQGSLSVLGEDPFAKEARKSGLRKRIGGVLQENGQWQRIRVGEALRLFASLYGNQGPERAESVSQRLDLHELRKQFIERLSGGQRQRVFLALALLGNPDLLFLDEPTTGLDPQSRQIFWTHIKGLKREGRTVVLTTHYLEEAEQLCDHVIILNKGTILAQGSPEDLHLKAASRGGGNTPANLTETYLTLLSEGN